MSNLFNMALNPTLIQKPNKATTGGRTGPIMMDERYVDEGSERCGPKSLCYLMKALRVGDSEVNTGQWIVRGKILQGIFRSFQEGRIVEGFVSKKTEP